MNKTLLKQTIKENWVSLLIYTGVQMLLLFGIAGNAPISATGLAYYNIFPSLLMAIYVITTGTKLIASKVDSGSMAYILSTPNTRKKVAITQAVYFISSLFIMFTLTALTHIIAAATSRFGIDGNGVFTIIKLNYGLFFLGVLFSGITFFFSSLFNLSKHATALGGGIVGAFILLPMVAMFNTDLSWLKYFTPSTFFNPTALMGNGTAFILNFIILLVIGAVAYVGGVFVFNQRDLPL
ncbi:MAG: ABC transporter permease [Bacillales bacterium]|jgi:ABC-2 type transport system permease protein|nr:ABC transporter permease [Bacillales bacterium]